MTATDTTAETAFLRAIVAAGEDQLPRLQFADWLEDCGDANAAAWQRWLARRVNADWTMGLRVCPCGQFHNNGRVMGQFDVPACLWSKRRPIPLEAERALLARCREVVFVDPGLNH
jgi:uncharacterized protein (TIGR02996 family)